MKTDFAVLALTGLLLAQTTAPGTYNLGVPSTPGTRVPESNAATAVTAPNYAAPLALTPSGAGAGGTIAPSTAPSGPAYSFGAAPPPVVSPSR